MTTDVPVETRLKLARTQLQRARDLKRERNISDEEVDRRQTELLALNAELAAQEEAQVQARLNVARCQIEAPFTAVVTGRLASVGALAAPGTPLVQLVQLDDAEVSARIRPEEAKAGAAAESIAFSWQGERFPLDVLRTLPVVDPSTRTIEVRFAFSGASAPPGASGRVHWLSAAAFLPADLLVRRAGGLGVFLFNDNHAHFHPLPGALEGQPARAELPEGARIVVDGRHGLKNGQRVAIGSVASAPR